MSFRRRFWDPVPWRRNPVGPFEASLEGNAARLPGTRGHQPDRKNPRGPSSSHWRPSSWHPQLWSRASAPFLAPPHTPRLKPQQNPSGSSSPDPGLRLRPASQSPCSRSRGGRDPSVVAPGARLAPLPSTSGQQPGTLGTARRVNKAAPQSAGKPKAPGPGSGRSRGLAARAAGLRVPGTRGGAERPGSRRSQPSPPPQSLRSLLFRVLPAHRVSAALGSRAPQPEAGLPSAFPPLRRQRSVGSSCVARICDPSARDRSGLRRDPRPYHRPRRRPRAPYAAALQATPLGTRLGHTEEGSEGSGRVARASAPLPAGHWSGKFVLFWEFMRQAGFYRPNKAR